MTQEETDFEQLNEELRAKLLPDGGMITKYVVIAESINDEGEIDVIMNESAGMQMWDREGLLHHALFNWVPEIDEELLAEMEDEDEEDE